MYYILIQIFIQNIPHDEHRSSGPKTSKTLLVPVNSNFYFEDCMDLISFTSIHPRKMSYIYVT
jgi:hypothetical protein